jgi:hypothetical protein
LRGSGRPVAGARRGAARALARSGAQALGHNFSVTDAMSVSEGKVASTASP